MKWTLRLSAAALMLGISASAPAGLFGDAFSSHGRHGGDCCPQECVTAPSCEAPCEVDCVSTGHQRHKCGLFDRLRGMFDRGGLCDHGVGCANEGCCPQGCVGDCHHGPVGRATVGGPVRHAAPSPAAAPKKAAAPAPKKAAPAPMKDTKKAPAGEKAEAAPAPPTPDAKPKAAPAPAPPQDAEAYFPSRYRR